MSNPNTSEKSVDLDRQENITKGALSAKKVALYTYDSGSDTLLPISSPLKPGTDFDLITVTNTSSTTDELALTLSAAPVQTVTITYRTSSIPKVSDDIASVGFA